ncbi:MAG: hypothetical protein A2Y40_09145 [Candidatus Margulisbacteria bacterium GWF2_35_9]|nr:MAG: hypothetical protein A2Y40_09145 [Candidatus Margulisbacteria bacterium GWF2_35_9]
MHEMSLVMSIWDIVETEIEKHQYRIINEIELEVGESLGVISEFMETCFDAVKIERKETTKTKLKIITKQSIAKCNRCNRTWDYKDHWYICPDCGISDSEIIEGKGIHFLGMEIDE